MADRQDIDALLIGALYGELDGDERARLDAHLASHPQDRSALEGLRSTRQLLRDADLPVSFAVAEPSPAITAMLLQEAARRAPAPARGGFLAFLASLLKPFAASPALSAAAALVLVGGAAGLMYSRGTFRASEPSVGTDNVAVVDKLEASKSAGSAAPAPAPLIPAEPTAVDDYRVALADGESENKNEVAGAQLERERKGKRSAGAGGGGGGGGGGIGAGSSGVTFQSTAPTGTAKLDSANDSTKARPGYIALDKQSKDEPTVLALDGSRFEAAPATTVTGEADEDQGADKAEKKSPPPPPSRVALAEGRATPSDAPAAAPPPTAGASAGAGSSPKPIAGKAPAQKVARDQAKAGGKAYDPVKVAALDAWARDQHSRMVKLVNAGKCTDAGTVGAEIARKNPDYYQANVANDRAVRACRSYVDRARRAKSEDAKTKAAAPRNNAPDSPYQADMESAK